MIHRGTPDEELLEALRGGDLRAFDVLYLRYERRLFGYIRRMVVDRDLAEDLGIGAFFRITKYLRKREKKQD